MGDRLARLARLLDVERPIAGERTAWTVRTEHGVHAIELEQSVTGVRVRLDGATVARADAWSFDDEPFRFGVGGSRAVLAVRADAASGTVRASLIVDGDPVPADVPAWRRRRSPRVAWARVLARCGYALALALLAAATLGDPFRGWLGTALETAVDVVWLAAARGIDVFGLLPAWTRQVTASRSGMLLAGVELLVLLTVARDERIRRRVPVLRSSSRWEQAAGWIALAVAAGFLPTLLD